MSSNEYLSSKNRLFELLDDILCLPEISTDTVKFFKWEFKFLDLYLTLHSFIDEPEMLDVTQKVQALFEDALVDFSELDLVKYLDFYTSKVQNKICTFKTEIKAKYSFPKISLPLSANKDGIAIRNFVTGFINIALENLHDLGKIDVPCSLLNVPETMEHIEDVSKELKLLQNFASFVSERFIEPQSQHVDFFTHVLAVASHATMLSWLYFPGRGSKNQDFAPEEISLLLSDFLRMRIMPIKPSIRKIYIDVLQALKSTIQSGWYPNIRNEHAIDCAASFTKTILHNLVDLPTNSNSSQIVPLKDHLEILEEMLKLLRANIIHVPVQDFEPLLRDVDTVIIDVGLLVYSLYEGEEEKEGMELGKVNPALFRDQIDKPAHRMSIYCEKGYHIELSSSWSLASSVILHNTGLSSFSRDNNGLSADQVSYIFHNFKFLKVLDLNSVFIKSFPTELVYLRYFAAQTHVESVPSSLANLWNLQTLKLTKWPGKMTLPITLWEIAKFRHLHIFEGGFAIENAEELRVNSTKHYDLKTLSVAYFPCVEDAELILGTTPNLRYLRCEVKGVDNFEYCILKFPSQLETLKIRVTFEYDLEVLPFCISAPNLRNLRLSWVHLVPCHLSNIGLLQNLQVLKLDGAELENGEWEVSSDEFPQLKVLKLIKLLNFKEWTVADDAFLNLECLFLRECKNLKEIPSSFGDISSLKSIEVWECNECVTKSALDIQETQVEDYENSGFKVVIREKVVSDSGDDDDDDDDDDDSDW